MMITAAPQEARELGAVSRVVARGALDDVVSEAAATLAGKSQAALMLGRDAFFSVARADIDTALDRLQGGLTAIAGTDDAAEGVRAFLEKRAPVWSDT